MGTTGRRMTVKQWENAVNALRHVVADYESWDADDDPSAKDLLKGIVVLRRLIDERRPTDDWETLADTPQTGRPNED